MKHVHTYEPPPRYSNSLTARCTVCGLKRDVRDLVYLGDAPRSVGPGYLGSIVGR